jgi:LysM repeat protein
VISYPGYQVVVARQGETVRQIAGRLELNAQELARYNAIEPDTPLRRDEIVALPGRVAEPSPATGAERTGPIRPPSEVDVTTLAADAIDRAEPQQTPPAAEEPQTSAPAGAEPLRHRVERGETAYSIARLYGVPVRGLAEWNGLGADMTIREGQQLLIPATGTAPTPPDEEVTEPGRGTQAPTPPSAAEPLPADSPETGAAETPPPSPDIGDQSAAATDAPLVYPVSGSIIREYDPPQSRGIVFSTDPGEAVRAAADGTVRLISEEVNGTKFILVNHGNNISTVYIGVAEIWPKYRSARATPSRRERPSGARRQARPAPSSCRWPTAPTGSIPPTTCRDQNSRILIGDRISGNSVISARPGARPGR